MKIKISEKMMQPIKIMQNIDMKSSMHMMKMTKKKVACKKWRRFPSRFKK